MIPRPRGRRFDRATFGGWGYPQAVADIVWRLSVAIAAKSCAAPASGEAREALQSSIVTRHPIARFELCFRRAAIR